MDSTLWCYATLALALSSAQPKRRAFSRREAKPRSSRQAKCHFSLSPLFLSPFLCYATKCSKQMERQDTDLLLLLSLLRASITAQKALTMQCYAVQYDERLNQTEYSAIPEQCSMLRGAKLCYITLCYGCVNGKLTCDAEIRCMKSK